LVKHLTKVRKKYVIHYIFLNRYNLPHRHYKQRIKLEDFMTTYFEPLKNRELDTLRYVT